MCAIRQKKGSILLLALIFMIALAGIALAYISLISYDTKNVGGQINNKKAFYLAEAGLNKAVWYLLNTAPDGSTDGSWRTSSYPVASGAGLTDPQEEQLGEGTYTMWVETAVDDILITSRGEVSSAERIIIQRITLSNVGVPEAFEYVSFSESNIKFQNSNGTITGDIATGGSFTQGDMTSDGTITEGSGLSLPEVDFAAYEAAADYVINGNFTFQSGQTYNGIYYVDGKATFEDNVTLDGTIVAMGNIIFDKDSNAIITATSPNPAIVTDGSIIGNKVKSVQITGLIYATGSVTINNSEDSTITGSIVAGGHINFNNGDNLTIVFDPSILTSPPPYITNPGGGANAAGSVANTWREI
ncbi:MAG: pilus assembly PilX N-terminal domain-containing protein [Candidatus Zapsychrus exili]|nr:pilus assembly PilX N-terminal domain-containing protein [Candidatus Zapsychrus exili]